LITMKRIVNRLLSGLTFLGLASVTLAITSEGGGNPYQVLLERNAFDLKPIPPPVAVNTPPPAAPSKITLQGITVLFGKRQVLLKVAEAPEPGKPPKGDVPLIMNEGERRGALEVVRIDPDSREVEFKDSGTPVTLNLTNFITKTPAAAAGMIPPPPGIPMLPGGVPRPAIPNVPLPTPAPAFGAGAAGFGGAAVPGNVPQRPLRTTPMATMPTAATPLVPGVSSIPTPTPQPQPQFTREEQIVLMEIERERNKNNPNYPPLPPTELTPAALLPPPPPMPGK
jgi:hypothetical protein